MTRMQNTTCVQSPSLHAAPTPYAELQPKSSVSTPPAEPGPHPRQGLTSPPCSEHLCLVTSIPKPPAASCPGTTAPFYRKNSREERKTPSKAQGCKEKSPDQGDHMDVSPRLAACTAQAFVLMTRLWTAKALSGGSWPWRGLLFAPAPTTPQSRLPGPAAQRALGDWRGGPGGRR